MRQYANSRSLVDMTRCRQAVIVTVLLVALLAPPFVSATATKAFTEAYVLDVQQSINDPYQSHAVTPNTTDGYGHTVFTHNEAIALSFTQGVAGAAYASLSDYPQGQCCGGNSYFDVVGQWTVSSQLQQPGTLGYHILGDASTTSAYDSDGSWSALVTVYGKTGEYWFQVQGLSYLGNNQNIVQSYTVRDSNGFSASGNTSYFNYTGSIVVNPGDTVQIVEMGSEEFDAWGAAITTPFLINSPGYSLDSASPVSGPFNLMPAEATLGELGSSGVDVARLEADGFIPTPEPGTLVMVSTGILAAAFLLSPGRPGRFGACPASRGAAR